MKVNFVHSRLGVLADSVLAGSADIDIHNNSFHDFDCMLDSDRVLRLLLELLALINLSYTRLVLPRGVCRTVAWRKWTRC